MTDGVLVVGEALVDIVQRQDGSTETFPGGSAANVAVALARLGRDAGFVTSFADDEHGRLIADHLDGVGRRGWSTDPHVVAAHLVRPGHARSRTGRRATPSTSTGGSARSSARPARWPCTPARSAPC